ncbi:MAG: phospho-sugar mutase, partial [Clostridia bacterium]|nr:phospho-sugar mutase [Clostridia bacterium]
EQGTMPKNPVMVKTVVTSGLGDKIAAGYGVKTVNVLTGFKFIGEQIGLLEKQGRESDYIFGFEESYGYLTGGYVRDKDGVDGAFMICEMFAYYKTNGISLIDKLEELYAKYGRYENTLESVAFEGADGFEKMQSIMDGYRRATQIEGKAIVEKTDYINGINGLPKSNVIKFVFEDESTMVVRPSGTEPKLKIYRSFKR